MRESIGGAFLIKIMVVFIVLYNFLLAIAVNYAMAYRVRNQIINLVEQYEGCQGAEEHILAYVAAVGYYRPASPTGRDFTVVPHGMHTVNHRGTYYVVTTYITFHFPWIENVLHVEVSGETKVLYGVNEHGANAYHCNNLN